MLLRKFLHFVINNDLTTTATRAASARHELLLRSQAESLQSRQDINSCPHRHWYRYRRPKVQLERERLIPVALTCQQPGSALESGRSHPWSVQ
jgi:hypothetical protein